MNSKQDTEQKRWTYELTSRAIDGKDNLRYTTYGVTARDLNGDIAAAYGDVTTDKHGFAALVASCNENGLSVLHLEDILLDFIG